MRTVLVERQDIENMIGNLQMFMEIIGFLHHTLWEDKYDVDAYYLEKTGNLLRESREKLKSYLK